MEEHKGHFEHRSFLATGVLPTLTTSQLIEYFLCPSSFKVFYFVVFFKPFLILEGHKGHVEHRSFLATGTGTLPTLNTSQLMGHLLCPSSFEVVYFVLCHTLFYFGGTQGTL